MLVIDDTQMQVLGASSRESFIVDLCDHVREHFPASIAGKERPEVFDLVDGAVTRARGHRLTLRPDVCRFLNLCAVYGWGFDSDPALGWMRAFLADPEVSSPGQRLGLLVDECKRRMAVEAHNKEIRAAFARGTAKT